MSRFCIADQAKEDLADVWLYIAEDNPGAADRWTKNALDKFQLLAQNPQLGRAREELGPPLRSFPMGNYLIFYRPAEDGIEVVRVLSGYRDLDRLFPS